jgi:hypothetical protein
MEAPSANVLVRTDPEARTLDLMFVSKRMQCLKYPPPCPSPAWGEGTLWHCSAQPQAAFACILANVCIP